MKSRRNFIAKAGITAAGLTLLRPLTTSAAQLFNFKEAAYSGNRLVLLHTGSNPDYTRYADRKISALNNGRHHLLAIRHDSEEPVATAYEIAEKGNIKTGIIKVTSADAIQSINRLAARLKNEENCSLVVCVSALGYKNKNGKDDLTLAEKSDAVDIIISNHATNNSPFPIIARNVNRSEVIIHSATNNGFGLGNIEIEFDSTVSSKKSVAINNLLTRLPEKA